MKKGSMYPQKSFFKQHLNISMFLKTGYLGEWLDDENPSISLKVRLF